MKSERIEDLYRMLGKLEHNNFKQGIGLGLTVVNELSSRLNMGEYGLQIHSELEKGSCFEFSIAKDNSYLLDNSQASRLITMVEVDDSLEIGQYVTHYNLDSVRN